MEVLIACQVPAGWRHANPARARPTDSPRADTAEPDCTDHGIFKLTAWLFETPGAPFHRNLQLREQVLVTGEPAAEVLAALLDKHRQAQGLEKILGLTLTYRNLRGADLRDTFLPKDMVKNNFLTYLSCSILAAA